MAAGNDKLMDGDAVDVAVAVADVVADDVDVAIEIVVDTDQ